MFITSLCKSQPLSLLTLNHYNWSRSRKKCSYLSFLVISTKDQPVATIKDCAWSIEVGIVFEVEGHFVVDIAIEINNKWFQLKLQFDSHEPKHQIFLPYCFLRHVGELKQQDHRDRLLPGIPRHHWDMDIRRDIWPCMDSYHGRCRRFRNIQRHSSRFRWRAL